MPHLHKNAGRYFAEFQKKKYFIAHSSRHLVFFINQMFLIYHLKLKYCMFKKRAWAWVEKKSDFSKFHIQNLHIFLNIRW